MDYLTYRRTNPWYNYYMAVMGCRFSSLPAKGLDKIHRGSYMSANVFLDLLNNLGKVIKFEACRAFYYLLQRV